MVLFGSINRLIQETADKVFDDFNTFQKDVSTAGTPEQLPSNSVPKGGSVTITAKPTNDGYIYYARSKTDLDNNDGDILTPGQAVNLAISDTSLVYIDSENNGEGVAVSTEVE